MNLRLTLINHTATRWPNELAALWQALGAPYNPDLPPDYFIQTTFVKMGGRVIALHAAERTCGVALLFPRGVEAGRRIYTLRVSEALGHREHALGNRMGNMLVSSAAQRTATAEHQHLIRSVSELLATHMPEFLPLSQFDDKAVADIRIHYPQRAYGYAPSYHRVGDFTIGAPSSAELAAIRAMHITIWGATPGAQYPDDLHSSEFGPATSLVARAGDRLAGFLLGFYRFGGLNGLERTGVDTSLSIESQVMGIDPGVRRSGLAATLKRVQAAESLALGIGVIHWTADPLQFANAALNFHKLRAVAGEFYPAYYPFQNALNRVPASRFGIVWLPRTPWGQRGMKDRPRGDLSLSRFPGCVVLNAGIEHVGVPDGAAYIAIEIPADWTNLQISDLEAAQAWRSVTDTIFSEVIGYTSGRYLITDVASAGERRYLIGQPADLVFGHIADIPEQR